MEKTRLRALFVIVIASAGPMMLGLDFLLRHFLIASQAADVRAFMAEHVTPIAWGVVPFPLLGGVVGFRWYPARFRKSLERWRRDSTITPDVAAERADLEALFLTTTLAQLPAVLGDLSLILGAHVAPALSSTAVSVTAVIVISLFARERPRVR